MYYIFLLFCYCVRFVYLVFRSGVLWLLRTVSDVDEPLKLLFISRETSAYENENMQSDGC